MKLWILLIALAFSLIACNDAVDFRNLENQNHGDPGQHNSKPMPDLPGNPADNPLPPGNPQESGSKTDVPVDEPNPGTLGQIPDSNPDQPDNGNMDSNGPEKNEENNNNSEINDNPDEQNNPDINENNKPGDPSDGNNPDDPVNITEKTGDPAISLEAEGLPNFYKVSDDLYRSGQPGVHGLVSAENQGIKTILSLQLLNLDEFMTDAPETSLIFKHVSLAPTLVKEDELLEAMRIIHQAEKPVLVHCLHGSDRTGLVVAMYRIVFQHWSKDDAKNEMTSESFGYHEEFSNLLDLIDSIDVQAFSERVTQTN